MQALWWCFFSFRGRLNRQEFALAFFFLAAVSFVIGEILTSSMIGPTNGGLAWTDNELALAQLQAQMLASVFVIWPSLVIQVKRLRDTGYSWFYLAGANIIVGVVGAFALLPAIGLVVAGALFLFFAKGKAA